MSPEDCECIVGFAGDHVDQAGGLIMAKWMFTLSMLALADFLLLGHSPELVSVAAAVTVACLLNLQLRVLPPLRQIHQMWLRIRDDATTTGLSSKVMLWIAAHAEHHAAGADSGALHVAYAAYLSVANLPVDDPYQELGRVGYNRVTGYGPDGDAEANLAARGVTTEAVVNETLRASRT